MAMIRDKKALEAHLALWKDGEPADKKPIGYVLSIEGADSFITVNHVERAYAYGLRAVGPAHYGPGRYANGFYRSSECHGERVVAYHGSLGYDS